MALFHLRKVQKLPERVKSYFQHPRIAYAAQDAYLTAGLISQGDSPPPLLHPSMAGVYHRKIQDLHTALNSEDSKTEAAEILRSLIDAIILTPEDNELTIYLKGDLAGILNLAQNKREPIAKVGNGSDHIAQQVSYVAGERKHREHTYLRIAI